MDGDALARTENADVVPRVGDVRACILAIVACMALVANAPAWAIDMSGGKTCADKVSTMDIVQCMSAATKMWDERLNVAYAALQRFVDPGQREPLQVAQRLWIKYRDANCGFYGAGEGSITQLRESECTFAMTRERTLELEEAARP